MSGRGFCAPDGPPPCTQCFHPAPVGSQFVRAAHVSPFRPTRLRMSPCTPGETEDKGPWVWAIPVTGLSRAPLEPRSKAVHRGNDDTPVVGSLFRFGRSGSVTVGGVEGLGVDSPTRRRTKPRVPGALLHRLVVDVNGPHQGRKVPDEGWSRPEPTSVTPACRTPLRQWSLPGGGPRVGRRHLRFPSVKGGRRTDAWYS